MGGGFLRALRFFRPSGIIAKLRRLRALVLALERTTSQQEEEHRSVREELRRLRDGDVALKQSLDALQNQVRGYQDLVRAIHWASRYECDPQWTSEAIDDASFALATLREIQSAFTPNYSDYVHTPPFVRLRRIEALPLEGARVGVLSAFPWTYSESVVTRNPARVVELQLAGASGPLWRIGSGKGGDLEREGPFPVGLASVPPFLEAVDDFWIPDPYLASLAFRSPGFLGGLGCSVSRTLVFSLPVSYRTILETQTGSVRIGNGAFPLAHDDNQVRSMLHRNGFIEVARLAPLDGRIKTTRYHEQKGFYVLEASGGSQRVLEDGEVQLEWYRADKLPRSQVLAPGVV